MSFKMIKSSNGFSIGFSSVSAVVTYYRTDIMFSLIAFFNRRVKWSEHVAVFARSSWNRQNVKSIKSKFRLTSPNNKPSDHVVRVRLPFPLGVDCGLKLPNLHPLSNASLRSKRIKSSLTKRVRVSLYIFFLNGLPIIIQLTQCRVISRSEIIGYFWLLWLFQNLLKLSKNLVKS